MSGQATISVMKADGTSEPFSSQKLRESLRRAGADDSTQEEIERHVSLELINGISTTDIYHHAFELLRKHKHPAAARYSLRRALVGFGATGFPFQTFVGEVYKSRGYTVETGKMVKGRCVSHEVDVVAYNDQELVMSEVKFHNELGFKSDLKIALYVKARIDDLSHSQHFYGNKQRRLNRGSIVTNTKFTTSAIQYAECAGLEIIGWNYPAKGNLQDMIEEGRLHPLSCLTTLSLMHREALFDKGVVLCKSLGQDESLIRDLSMNSSRRIELREEIKNLCGI